MTKSEAAHIASRLLASLSAPRKARCLPADQAVLLLLLKAGDEMAIREIQGLLGISQAGASEIVDRATRAGLVERFKSGPALPRVGVKHRGNTILNGIDARETLVRLTPKGHLYCPGLAADADADDADADVDADKN